MTKKKKIDNRKPQNGTNKTTFKLCPTALA